MQLTGEMMDELYGKDETNINVFGWLIRKPEAGLFGEITNKHIHGGICFGMAFSSPRCSTRRTGSTFSRTRPLGLEPRRADKRRRTPALIRDPALLAAVLRRADPDHLGQVAGQAINAHDPSADVQRDPVAGRAGQAATAARPGHGRGAGRPHDPRLRLAAGPATTPPSSTSTTRISRTRSPRRASGSAAPHPRVPEVCPAPSATPTATGKSSRPASGRAGQRPGHLQARRPADPERQEPARAEPDRRRGD